MILAETQSIQEIAEHTVDAMYTALGHEYSIFMIAEDDNLSVISQKGARAREAVKARNISVPLTGKTVTARAATSKKSLLIPDIREDPEWETILGVKPEEINTRARARPFCIT